MASSDELDRMAARLYRAENALKWVNYLTATHYLGGAFEPGHMRDLSNMAADALDCQRDLPDYEETTAAAREKARVRAAKWSELFGAPEQQGGQTDG